MPRILATIERAYRGTVEEQYAHILWLCRSLRAFRAEISILLRGEAVLYARQGQPSTQLCIGGLELAHLPHYESSLSLLRAEGVPVYVAAADVRRLNLGHDDLCPGVAMVDAPAIARLVASHSATWYW